MTEVELGGNKLNSVCSLSLFTRFDARGIPEAGTCFKSGSNWFAVWSGVPFTDGNRRLESSSSVHRK